MKLHDTKQVRVEHSSPFCGKGSLLRTPTLGRFTLILVSKAPPSHSMLKGVPFWDLSILISLS